MIWLWMVIVILLALQVGSAYSVRFVYRGRPAHRHPRRRTTREAVLTSERPIEEVRQATVAAMQQAGATIVATSTPDAVRGFTGVGWRTYGSMITAWFVEDAGRTRIDLESTTATPTQLFDWGESAAKLQDVTAALTRYLGSDVTDSRPPPPPPPPPS